MEQSFKISSGSVLPAKVIGCCVITFCLYLGLRYFPDGISEKDYLKAGAGLILFLFPAFFTHHLLILKFIRIENKKVVVKDLFNTLQIDIADIASFKRLNYFTYEIVTRSGKKYNSLYFWLNEPAVEWMGKIFQR
jgi:hypothetical protein